MRKLTKIIAPALIAVAAVGTAGAASAQPYKHHTPARAEAVRTQIAMLEQRVNRADNRDRISEREANALRRDVRNLRYQFRDYNRNGLDNREFSVLRGRIDQIRTRLRMERFDWNGRRW